MKWNKPIYPVIFGSGLYFFANVQRVAIPGNVFNELQRDFNASAPVITGLGAVFMYLYAVNQLFAGILNDRFGGVRVILFGAIPFCIGSLLFPLSHSVGMIYLARALTGIGASMIYLSLVTEILRNWPGSGGVGISLVVMTGFIGGIMANAPFAIAASQIGYRSLLVGIGLVTVLFYLLFLSTGFFQPKPALQVKTGIFARFKQALSRSQNIQIFLLTGFNFGLYYVLQTVLGKKFLEDCCHYSAQNAAWILSAMGAFSSFSGFGMAVLCRKNPDRTRFFLKTAGVMIAAVYLLTGLLLSLDIMPWFIGVLFCMLAVTSSLGSITIPFLVRMNGQENAGTCAALLNFCFYTSVAVFGNVAGHALNVFSPARTADGYLVYPAKSYLLVFGIFSVFAVAVLLLSLRIRPAEEK